MLGGWACQVPYAAVGLWVGAVLAVPMAAISVIAASVMASVLADGHTRQLRNLAPAVGAGVLAVLLLVATVRVGRRFVALNAAARRRRRRHELIIALFATSRPDLGKVAVIADDRLFAYSLPCIVYGRIVLSQGVLDELDPAALNAVLAHERAHLLARHHLILQLANAIADTYPRTAHGLAERITELSRWPPTATPAAPSAARPPSPP